MTGPMRMGDVAANSAIGYCANVHPGATLKAMLSQLDEHAVAVRERLGWDRLRVGLWLSESALAEIAKDDDAARLRDWLDERNLDVRTINGFPQGDFHESVVKHRVYEPDWANPRRAAYTLRLAEVLAVLLPDGATGSISTVPIGWPSGDALGDHARCDMAAVALHGIAGELDALEDRTGRCVRLAIEPEPGCMLGTTAEALAYFDQHLADDAIRARIGLCYDVCHAAVMFEDQAASLAACRAAGVGVYKVQVSSAIVCRPGVAGTIEALQAFAEPRYLHQTCARGVGGEVRLFEDLPTALESTDARGAEAWRVHFHVPIFHADLGEEPGVLETTRDDVNAALAALDVNDAADIEVETYAWGVLPERLRPTRLADGIAEELAWAAGQMKHASGRAERAS